MKFKVTLDIDTENDPAVKEMDIDSIIALRYFMIEVIEAGIINLPHNSKNEIMNAIREQIRRICFNLDKENILIES